MKEALRFILGTVGTTIFFAVSLALWMWFVSRLPINRWLRSQELLREVRARSKKVKT
jgi:hypothetical protein